MVDLAGRRGRGGGPDLLRDRRDVRVGGMEVGVVAATPATSPPVAAPGRAGRSRGWSSEDTGTVGGRQPESAPGCAAAARSRAPAGPAGPAAPSSRRRGSAASTTRRAPPEAALTAGGAVSQPIAAGSLAREADARWSTTGGRVTCRRGRGRPEVRGSATSSSSALSPRPTAPQGDDARQHVPVRCGRAPGGPPRPGALPAPHGTARPGGLRRHAHEGRTRHAQTSTLPRRPTVSSHADRRATHTRKGDMSRFGQLKRRSSTWLRREIARPASPRAGPTRPTSSQNSQVPYGPQVRSRIRTTRGSAPGPIIHGVNVVLPEIRRVQDPVQRVLGGNGRRQEQVSAFPTAPRGGGSSPASR